MKWNISWEKIIISGIILALVLDFACYQLYGVGLIFGNVCTIDIKVNTHLEVIE